MRTKAILYALLLFGSLAAGAAPAVPAPAGEPLENQSLAALLSPVYERTGRLPDAAWVNDAPVPVAAALRLLAANADLGRGGADGVPASCHPSCGPGDGVVYPTYDLGVGVRGADPNPCYVGAVVVTNSWSFDAAAPPPPTLVNVHTLDLAPSEPLTCLDGTLLVDSWVGSVAADIAPSATLRWSCVRGTGPVPDGLWLSGHEAECTPFFAAEGFASASITGRVALVDVVLEWFPGQWVRIGQMFGATHAGPDGHDVAVVSLGG